MELTQQALADLAALHNTYINRARANGATILTFDSPCCKKPIETPAAGLGQTWDTLTTCHHCGELFMKFTWPTAAVGHMP